MQRSNMIKKHSYSKKQIREKADSFIASAYGMPPPTNNDTASRLAQIDDMKYFFATATQQWDHNKSIKRFSIYSGESIACVLWDGLFFITGTDIVRSLTFRFHAFGRPVTNVKKFEEGIFSDLRNLKPGIDARLEEPKSELLDMLYKNNCIRTQKKQKVFFWFSVPHDRLFLDALERDLKREKMGLEPTTQAVAEPAASLSLDSTQELFDQFKKNMSQLILKDEITPIPNSSVSAVVPDHSSVKKDPNWTTSPTPTPWPSQSENMIHTKRSRLALQKQKYASHGSYFAPDRSRPVSSSNCSILSEDIMFHDDASCTTTLTDISKSSISSPLCKGNDYMDPISNGVNQLEITSSISNTSTSSKSLDPKKSKAIFGNLTLFEGSPSYKIRRRRASVSTSALNPQINSGVRRHEKCHVRTTNNTTSNTVSTSNNSRLAMAAVKAGFAPHQLMTTPLPVMSATQSWRQSPQDFYCPVPECRHLFKRIEHLERHMQSLHMFICNFCGKHFHKAETLGQHQRLKHFEALHHQSPRPSFDESRSAGWSTGIGSHSSSRCSTLSPMLDVDFEMSERKKMSDVKVYLTNRKTESMKLLSPFKPIDEQQDEQANQMELDNSNDPNYQSIYAPYVDQQYTPFITSPDMNIVFGA